MTLQKNRIVSLVVFYVLLSATFSFIPAIAQSPVSPDIIHSILAESRNQVEQKITELEDNGITIPPSALALYEEGLAEYNAALLSLYSENLDEARDHALEAMSLFEDATEVLYEAEVDFQDEQEAFLNEIFELEEAISNSESDADELQDLALENNLDVSFTDYDDIITAARELLAEGDLDGARQQYEIAQNLLADIYDQIHDEAYSNLDQRSQDFVADTITQLNEIIENASELGISPSIIDQLQDIIDDLQNAESTDEIIDAYNESSYLNDLTTENPDWTDEESMEDAEDAIEDAQKEIDKADEKISKANEKGKDTALAQQQLDDARDKLTMAIASFDSEDFEEAEVLAEEAEDLASDARGKLIGKTLEDLAEYEGEEEEKLKIRAKTLGTNAEVKVIREFSFDTTEIDLVTQIVDNFPILEGTADTLLKIGEADVSEELEEKFKVKAKEKDGDTEVKVELRFILNSIDRDAIIAAIVEKMNEVTSGQIEDALEEGEGELKIRAKTFENDAEVKVIREFSFDTTEIYLIVNQIVDNFPILEGTAGNLLKIESAVGGEPEEKFKVKAKEKDGDTEVKVELRFILNSIDRDVIIAAIVDMTQLTDEQILQIDDALQAKYEGVDGIVTGILDGTITLETDDGPVTILTDGNTKFKGFDDLSEIDGLEVEVKAVETNDGLLATEIDLEGEVETQSGDGEEEEEIKLDGIVTGILDGTITLETDDGPVTILTDGNTKFKGFDDLSEIDGLEVEVKAVETNDGLLATEIDLEEYEGEVETQSGDGEDDNSG